MTTAMRMDAPNEEKPKREPPMTLAVICSIAALTTKVNRPKVNNVRGNASIDRMGRIIAFKIDKIKLATNAVKILST